MLMLGLAVGASAAPLHPSAIPSRKNVPLGSAVWYACADPAYGGPAALACKVQPTPPATAADLAASYSSTFTTNFARYTPENEFKMLWTEPSRNRFDFAVADKVAGFARAHGMQVHGHTLIYAAANPGWVDRPLIPWFRITLLAAMRNHITKQVTHFASAYPGVVDEWDVVNEPFVDSGARDQNVYQRVIGNDWIEQAFRAANAADPNALLYLNEFNADSTSPRQQAVLALVKDFLARGVPIDGVGLEMHIGAGGSYPTLDALESVMGQYAALGLRVTITELDVLKPVPDDDGTVQRAAYDTVAQACREMTNCMGVNVWGVADPYSWRGLDQHADLFDASFTAKPAYADVRCRLDDPKPATGDWTPQPCPPTPPVPATAVAQPTGPTDGSSAGSDPASG
jgi:endo-1,4-beta-xylanase